MLTCKDFLRELNDYLDETTDPELKKQLERHVNECPNCWVIFDTSKKTINVYQGMEPKAIPQTVHDKLMAALERRMASKSS